MSRYTLSQSRVIDNLLELGGSRPFASPKEAIELKDYIEKSVGVSLFDWAGSRIYVTKSMLRLNDGCEVSYLADLEKKGDKFSITSLVGSIVHKAIQISYTHPTKNQQEIVAQGLKALRIANQDLDEWYSKLDIGTQSEILSSSESRFVAYLDDWPRLDPSWTPRFEEPVTSKFKHFTLSARPDLILGRPHTDFKRTMLIVDFKTGQLKEEQHRDEALFYALLTTLRYGVTPWRSIVYSLSGGDWSEPDFSVSDLMSVADKVVNVVKQHSALLSSKKEPIYRPGEQCTWCILKERCTQKNSNN